jgi:hypothetical protein
MDPVSIVCNTDATGCGLTYAFIHFSFGSSLMSSSCVRVLGVLSVLLSIGIVLAHADPIRVRYRQGSTHGFAALKTVDGTLIATGEITQTVRGDEVTSRLAFRFRDGSVDDDQTIFTQRGTFRLIKDHHVQHGPSFPKPIDVLIDANTGQITSRAADGKLTVEHLDLPPDVSNGLPPNLLLNILPSTPETEISYVVPGDKPRLIHLSIKPTGTLPFKVGGVRRTATDFTIHVELGGVTALVAPLLGKEPKDFHIWIMPGVPPAFVREEGQMYEGGPIWRVEQISASFVH